MGKSKLGLCSCCGDPTTNECVFVSRKSAYGKPWPALTNLSGASPSEITDALHFTSAGHIQVDHGRIPTWDSGSQTFIPGGTIPVKKRWYVDIKLNSDTSDTWFHIDGPTQDYSFRVSVRNNTGYVYPVVNVVFYGTGVHSEMIIDRWTSGYRLRIQTEDSTAPYDSSNTAAVLVLTPDKVTAGSKFRPTSVAVDGQSDSIQIDHKHGDVEVCDTIYGETPAGRVSDCPGVIATSEESIFWDFWNSRTLPGTAPTEVNLTMPTLVTNPDKGAFVPACADCSSGGGSIINMTIDEEEYNGVHAPFGYVRTLPSGAFSYGCEPDPPAIANFRFLHWEQAVDIWYGTGGALGPHAHNAAETDSDFGIWKGLNVTDPLDSSGGSHTLQYNLHVAIDHINTLNPMVWKVPAGNTSPCMMTGAAVTIDAVTA